MLKVGFFGTEGVGKTSVSMALSFIMSYLMEEEGKMAAVMDANLHNADLTYLFLGNEGFHGLHDVLLGNKFPEEVVYDPLISLEDSSIRRKLSDLIKLKVIPAGSDDVSTLLYEPIDLLLLRLRSLEEYIREIGVEFLIVDFPSSDYSARVLLKALSRWVSLLIPVLLPDKNSILQTKRHLFSLDINNLSTPFVIINKYGHNLQSTELQELVKTYWNVPAYLLPFDESFSRCIQSCSISLSRMHEATFYHSLIEGFNGDIDYKERSVAKHLIKIFRKDFHFVRNFDNQVPTIDLGASGQGYLSNQYSDLLEETNPRLEAIKGIVQAKEVPVPKDIYREIESSSFHIDLFPFFRRKVRLRFSDGMEAFITRKNLKEALLLAGLDEKTASSLTARQELDISSLSQEYRMFLDLALSFLKLKGMGRDFIEPK